MKKSKAKKQRGSAKTSALLSLAAVLVITAGLLVAGQNALHENPGIGQTNTLDTRPMLTQVNDVRAKAQKAPLTETTTLDQAAQAKAQKLADTLTRGHQLPNGEPIYKEVFDRIKGSYSVGENVAWCQTSDQQRVQEWAASPGHYKTMIEDRWSSWGHGEATGKDGCVYAVNEFISK